MVYKEYCGLHGRVWAVCKCVGCVEECELCGIAWAMWNRVGYNEKCGL